MLMPTTAAPSWRANKPKLLWPRRSATALLLSLELAGCAHSLPIGAPRLPAPAADLTAPAPTGSAYLESVSPELKALDADLARWEQMLRDSLTR